jgi:hypothetical protein
MRRLLLVTALVSGLVLAAAAGDAMAAPSSRETGRAVVLLGNPRVAPHRTMQTPGRFAAFTFRARRSGVAHTIDLYVDRSNTARVITASIFSSNKGDRGSLLAKGSLNHPALGRWNRISVRGVRISEGGTYWLALRGSRGMLAYREAGACRSRSSSGTCLLSAYLSGISAVSPPGSATPPPKAPAPPRPAGSCFASPGACSYPDPAYHNVGASSPCAALTPSGSITASTPGQTLQGRNVTGTITVRAPNVTINNVCVTTDGGGQLGSAAITLVHGAQGTLIEHTTVAGLNSSDRSVEIATANGSGNNATLSQDYFYNCGECVHDQPWAVNDSYIISNGMRGTSDHYEDVYCSGGTVSLNHDTLLNPQGQVAEVFCDTGGGSGGACSNHVSVSNSLLAGGGYTLYPCGNASSVGSSTMSITNNRFGRCTKSPFRQTDDGGYDCQGATSVDIGSGADLNGYWPYGGHYGLDSYTYCPPIGGQTWSGNVWDNNNARANC